MNDSIVLSGDLDYQELLERSRKQMFQIQALSARLAHINDLAAALNSLSDFESMLRVMGEYVQGLIAFDHCSAALWMGDAWRLWTLKGDSLSKTIEGEDDLALGYTLRTGNPRLVLNNRGVGIFDRFASYLVVPLMGDHTVIGTLHFAAVSPQAFSIEDLRVARLVALQLSSALRSAERYHALQRVQTALSQKNDELQARNEELDAYNQIIAHDLKAPLNAIYGYASLLSLFSSDEFKEKGAVYVKQIIDSAMHMNGMIEQLLWLAKAQHAPLTPADVTRVLSRVSTRLEHLFVGRGVELIVQPGLPPALGHEAWLEEIFANLLTNGIKYMGADPNPRVIVRGARQGDFCRYEVQDNGIGIEASHLKTVFQMFSRVNPGEVEGHGLGLSIVARLVKRLGGEVGVESEVGVGSTFWFTLPAADV